MVNIYYSLILVIAVKNTLICYYIEILFNIAHNARNNVSQIWVGWAFRATHLPDRQYVRFVHSL